MFEAAINRRRGIALVRVSGRYEPSKISLIDGFVEGLAKRVVGGAATITVHPRGAVETERAAEILEGEGAVEVVGHDLENQPFEHAASRGEGYWVRHFMLDNPTGADCIYCRLFPGHKH